MGIFLKLKEITNFNNNYDPKTVDDKTFFAKLREQIILSQKNKFYSELCQKNDYTLPDEINNNNLEFIPYFSTNNYKITKKIFPNLTKVPQKDIIVWSSSSSTTGDPSLVARTYEDLEVIHYNALKCFDEFLFREKFQNTGMCFNFAPGRALFGALAKRTAIKKMKQYLNYSRQLKLIKKHDQAIRFFTSLMNKPWETIPARSHYLIQFKWLKTIWAIISTFGIRGGLILDSKFMIKQIEKFKNESIMFGGSPLLMNNVLVNKMLKEDIKFDLSETGYVGSGGGGWDGVKGQAKMEKIDKSEFVKNFKTVFNIESERLHDIYAFTESPILYGGHWSEKYQDYLHHCPDYARVIIRDIDSLEPVKEGGRGLLEAITPFGVNGSINMAVIVDDIVELISKTKCPECGNEGATFRVIGRTKDAPGQSCSSIIDWY
ncbi:MAG: LuxE/PaaK family acyltransferase [Candidatus Helarchaeota archaeon]